MVKRQTHPAPFLGAFSSQLWVSKINTRGQRFVCVRVRARVVVVAVTAVVQPGCNRGDL